MNAKIVTIAAVLLTVIAIHKLSQSVCDKAWLIKHKIVRY